MPANILIFDADYVSELTAKMNMACELFAEAVMSLKSATNHDRWKCKERARIADEFDELNLKLGRLDNGVNETTRILGGSVSRFASLESQYETQANNLSDELTSNHGFTASVRTGSGGYSAGGTIGAGTTGAAGAAGAVGTGTLGASAGQESGNSDGNGQPSGRAGTRTGRGMSGMNINAGSMFGRRTDADKDTGTGANTGATGSGATVGGGMMSVNLPVTHIPDSPDSAARGTKDAQAIADAALSSVAGAITEALSGGNPSDLTAERLSEVYNAGRSIYEASAAIIASPSQPHTSERLTMAAGIVALAQGGGNFQGTSSTASGNITRNAGLMSSALQGNSEATELRGILEALSGQDTGSISSSGSDDRSFFDMIIDEIKKMFSGGTESYSSYGQSLASSSPITEFLGNLVMDRAV